MELSSDDRAELRKLITTIRDSLSEVDAILGLGLHPANPDTIDVKARIPGPRELEVLKREPIGKFEYRWPNGVTKYMEAERYTVNCDDAEYVFAIGAEEGGRPSYQRDDRGRIVVFIRSRRSENSYYPLVEFAESDLGPDLYAAIVPQPAAPKKGTTADDLSDLREVPHLANADLRRADEVFLSLRNGPSLRLLVDHNNPELMIKHAWWVGGLRGTSS